VKSETSNTNETADLIMAVKLPEQKVAVLLLIWLARFVALGLILYTSYMFYRFAENDFAIGVLAYAFLLCFSVGAITFIPLLIIAHLIARSQHKPTIRQGVWVLALATPWLPATFFLLQYKGALLAAGLLCLGLSLLYSVWAIWHIRKMRKMNTT